MYIYSIQGGGVPVPGRDRADGFAAGKDRRPDAYGSPFFQRASRPNLHHSSRHNLAGHSRYNSNGIPTKISI
ncbi:hypothetical protein DAPPUDRAFT_307044 [Daphnia pulex]|uniref:Uncharacterized protein n=1 Tax=Daphnia pulex TaxID=6669 RepID=E9G083_DAPPU|nr:hypothetical protein DAPPUDRAFT_307044 [Daphnia pulex]|eukprot:EFX86856.1 hypothetical protein DAPPUDRAFT_307044 [Daphnia pulex]